MNKQQRIAVDQALRILGRTSYTENRRCDMISSVMSLAIALQIDSPDLREIRETATSLNIDGPIWIGPLYWERPGEKIDHNGGTIIDPDNTADLIPWFEAANDDG